MKILTLLLALFACCFFCVGCNGEVPMDERPMYGNKEGDKIAAYRAMIRDAWGYYYKGDLRNATRRFNQAWVLEPNNIEAFYGLGTVMSKKGETDEAIKLFEKGLELAPTHPLCHTRLGREYTIKASRMAGDPKKGDEVKKLCNDAVKLFEMTEPMLKEEIDKAFNYYEWAVALELGGDYKSSWEKLKLARKHDRSVIDQGFVRKLTMHMPEPKD